MAVPFSNTKLRVPKGFQNILEGLAREILRNQPDNPFEFGSKYFEQLLRVRDETGHDPAVHGARLEDRFYNNDSFKSPSVDPNSPEQQDAALKIQTNYRKHAAEQEVSEMREEDAAEKIQAGFRGYQDRQKFQEMKSPEKKQEEEEEVDIDLNDPDVEKAAVKIQAGFKGFKARQEIKDQKDKQSKPDAAPSSPEAAPKQEEEEVDIDLSDPDVNAAAIKIQAGFRGFQTRKEIIDKKENKGAASEKKEDKPATQEEGKEEVDLDLNDPELADAALKIQTGFRGHLARKEVEAMKEETQKDKPEEKKAEEGEEEVDIDLNDPDVEHAALKIQAGFKGMKARQEIQALKDTKEQDAKIPEEEEKVDIDLKDPETEKAALKIQAGFKGYQTRKELGKKKEDQDKKTEETPKTEEKKEEEEAVDIDLNDPEVAKAATKIQAGFKGYKTRKEISVKKESGTEPSTEKAEEKAEEKSEEKTEEKVEEKAEEKTEGEEEVDIDLNDPDVAKAALKIQAGFKGFKTRKDIERKKDDDKQEGN